MITPTPIPVIPGETDPPRPPPDGKRKPEVKPIDPRKQLTKAAATCRKKHKAPPKPLVTIDYAIASDGRVTRALPTTNTDALGKCLAAAVKATRFPPQLKLGLRIEL